MTIDTLQIKLSPGAKCPLRANKHDAGMDFYWPEHAGDVYLLPDDRTDLIDTGVAVDVPVGWALLLVPRSGMGTRGANLANTIGVIDHGYQKPIKAMIHNTGPDALHWNRGDRFMQGLLAPVATPKLQIVDAFPTANARGGHGSTGQ